MDLLQTTGEVIDALGGTAAVARRMGRRMTVVSNWRTGGNFPANTYLTFTAALADIGKEAPARLWGMVGAEVAA
ncbi:hypothetical protein [uncultured Methylobacterium sp.]|uniref:hypothetical protein n=1 Tax=uncultured Methylobacterium sp. TaxID=157278 RepID=UPI0035CC0DB9